MLAIEVSTSSDCAREMRGTASIASAVIGLRASTSTTSGFSAGCSSAINVAPGFIWSSSASDGALIANTTSACQASPTVASASTKLSSGKSARCARLGCDDDVVSQLPQLADGLRCGRDACLAGLGLSHHTDKHGQTLGCNTTDVPQVVRRVA